jgi:NAD(P)-dependent dehydrogenase (short-subunit alcohol dehydrogenase family)
VEEETVEPEDMNGKVALITGGANGIGAGAAGRLAAMGADVVIADVDEEAGRRVAEEVGGIFVACDVGTLEDSEQAVATAVDRFGGLDIAFLNAGIASGTDLAEFDEAAYRHVMRVNLDGPVFGAVAARPALVARGGGDIVITASLAGLTGVPPDPLYAANKHAVVGLVRSLGPTWVEQGIRVNALCPGFTDTAIIDGVRDLLNAVELPLLGVDDVVEAFMAVLGSKESGACWFVQPGRAPAPFEFRNLPGPRSP